MPTVSVSVVGGITQMYLALSSGPSPILTNADGTARATCGLIAEEGLGLAPMHRLSDRSPAQHGVTDRGYRLDARMISLVLLVNASSYADLEDARSLLLSQFRPRDTPMTLAYFRDNGDIRAITVFTAGDLVFGQRAPQGTWLQVGVKLIAPSPLWYDPFQKSAAMGIGTPAAGMAVPWKIPWQLGASAVNQSRTITYGGSFPTLPIVTILGPITNAVITNETTGEKLDFTGTTIAGGDTYTINCELGTVKDASNVSKIGNLTTDSNLTTFSLEAAPDVSDGINTITMSGSSTSSATNVYVTWYDRFIGI